MWKFESLVSLESINYIRGTNLEKKKVCRLAILIGIYANAYKIS